MYDVHLLAIPPSLMRTSNWQNTQSEQLAPNALAALIQEWSADGLVLDWTIGQSHQCSLIPSNVMKPLPLGTPYV